MVNVSLTSSFVSLDGLLSILHNDNREIDEDLDYNDHHHCSISKNFPFNNDNNNNNKNNNDLILSERIGIKVYFDYLQCDDNNNKWRNDDNSNDGEPKWIRSLIECSNNDIKTKRND